MGTIPTVNVPSKSIIYTPNTGSFKRIPVPSGLDGTNRKFSGVTLGIGLTNYNDDYVKGQSEATKTETDDNGDTREITEYVYFYNRRQGGRSGSETEEDLDGYKDIVRDIISGSSGEDFDPNDLPGEMRDWYDEQFGSREALDTLLNTRSDPRLGFVEFFDEEDNLTEDYDLNWSVESQKHSRDVRKSFKATNFGPLGPLSRHGYINGRYSESISIDVTVSARLSPSFSRSKDPKEFDENGIEIFDKYNKLSRVITFQTTLFRDCYVRLASRETFLNPSSSNIGIVGPPNVAMRFGESLEEVTGGVSGRGEFMTLDSPASRYIATIRDKDTAIVSGPGSSPDLEDEIFSDPAPVGRLQLVPNDPFSESDSLFTGEGDTRRIITGKGSTPLTESEVRRSILVTPEGTTTNWVPNDSFLFTYTTQGIGFISDGSTINAFNFSNVIPRPPNPFRYNIYEKDNSGSLLRAGLSSPNNPSSDPVFQAEFSRVSGSSLASFELAKVDLGVGTTSTRTIPATSSTPERIESITEHEGTFWFLQNPDTPTSTTGFGVFSIDFIYRIGDEPDDPDPEPEREEPMCPACSQTMMLPPLDEPEPPELPDDKMMEPRCANAVATLKEKIAAEVAAGNALRDVQLKIALLEDKIAEVKSVQVSLNQVDQRFDVEKPDFISFSKSDLIRTFIQMEETGEVTVDRGIFILPSEEETPMVDGIPALDPDPKNFRSCVAPSTALTQENLYQGFNRIPFEINIGSTFTRWTTLGIATSKQTYSPGVIPKPTIVYSDGMDGSSPRPPHPSDHIYSSQISSGEIVFRHLTYHSYRRFFEVETEPSFYVLDFWANLLANGSYLFAQRAKPGVRSKDLYSTESGFKLFQSNSDSFSPNLDRYTLKELFLPRTEYIGTAANTLRIFPSLRGSDQSGIDDDKKFPFISYQQAQRGGGAYYVSARYPVPSLYNHDISINLNSGAYRALTQGESFISYYHHDMYQVNDAHLRPSTFIHSIIKAAGIEPDFSQNGSDLDGPMNNHKMQLIESTDASYRGLIQRVLPSLGYIIRINPGNGKTILVDILTRKNPTFQFGDEMIQIDNIDYDVSNQHSSFIFENLDMLRGVSTLEEWKGDPTGNVGRYVVFNSNPFINGRTLTLQTGTWTGEFDNLSTLLSLRQDRYTWSVSNFHLINESSKKLEGPQVGDRVRLKSQKIPTDEDFVDILVMSKNQNELSTTFSGISFGEI